MLTFDLLPMLPTTAKPFGLKTSCCILQTLLLSRITVRLGHNEVVKDLIPLSWRFLFVIRCLCRAEPKSQHFRFLLTERHRYTITSSKVGLRVRIAAADACIRRRCTLIYL